MKFLAFVLTGVFSLSALGASIEILGSNYELRHQRLIAVEVAKQCGAFELAEVVESATEIIHVDQGIVDKRFTTVLLLSEGAHSRTAVVTTYFGDHYDHESKNWGAYSVEATACDHPAFTR